MQYSAINCEFVINSKYSGADKMLSVENDVGKKFYIEQFRKLNGRFPGVSVPSESTTQQMVKIIFENFEKK
jgi:hypothetical protein